MTEPASTHPVDPHAEPHVRPFRIWFILLGFTIAEYFYAMYGGKALGIPLLIVGLLSMALYKATLVALYFMHLKFEGKWVYAMLVPTAFLMIVFMVGLTPDVALHDSGEELEATDDDQPVAAAPAMPLDRSAQTVIR